MLIRIVSATVFILWLLLASSRPASGQVSLIDSSSSTAVAAATKLYTDSFINPPQLYSGPEYVDYALRYHARTGHQFYPAPDKQPGSVHYNGQHFTNLALLYDVVLDQVVLPNPSSPLMLRLINERVQFFTINDQRFIRLVADSASGGIRTGFYEVLVDGDMQVLAKRAKRQQEKVKEGQVDVTFTATNKLFIKKAGLYYPVSSKSTVARLLADRNKEVQQYIQEHKLKFNKLQREASTVKLVRYYYTLLPGSGA